MEPANDPRQPKVPATALTVHRIALTSFDGGRGGAPVVADENKGGGRETVIRTKLRKIVARTPRRLSAHISGAVSGFHTWTNLLSTLCAGTNDRRWNWNLHKQRGDQCMTAHPPPVPPE